MSVGRERSAVVGAAIVGDRDSRDRLADRGLADIDIVDRTPGAAAGRIESGKERNAHFTDARPIQRFRRSDRADVELLPVKLKVWVCSTPPVALYPVTVALSAS